MRITREGERKGGREWEGVSVSVRKRDEISNDFFFLSVIPYPVPCEETSFAIELYKRKHFSTLVSLLSTLVRTKITKPIPLCPIKISTEIFSSKFYLTRKKSNYRHTFLPSFFFFFKYICIYDLTYYFFHFSCKRNII